MNRKKITANFSDEIKKASVSFWYVKEGDIVKEQQPLVEFVTEKSSFTYPSPFSCKIIKQLAKEGDEVVLNQEIAEVEITQ